MKKLFSILLGLAISVTVFSQTSTLTLILRGDQSRQVLIDGRDYTPSGSYTLNDATVTVSLNAGQHELRVIRERTYYNTQTEVRTTFYLRGDYDKTIIVNSDGTMQQSETVRTTYGAGTKTAMSSYQFQSIYLSVQNERGYERRNRLDDVFSTSNYYFTTAQVRQLISLVNPERYRLELAKEAYDNTTDQWNYTQLQDLLYNQSSRDELRAFINNYRDPNIGYRVAMPDATFNGIYYNIRSRSSQAARVRLASSAFTTGGNYFSSYQERQIISLVRNERNKLELAKQGYLVVTDPENFSQVSNLLSSQAYRNDLAVFIQSSGGGINYDYNYAHPAMTDYTYNQMYREVQMTFGIGAKYSSLTTIFNNPNNYFTTDQAERLIRLVSSETNRLTLAKASYSHIVDPQNFSNLYDMLDSQSARAELEAYVRMNSRYR
jgi:hypothetical protein